MPRFDLYRARRHDMGFLVDVQADVVSHLDTRMVVPLFPTDRSPQQADRLNPRFLIEDVRYALQTQWMASTPRSALGRPIGTLAQHRDEIVQALDVLLTGF